jgi:alkanesulfonate monooxygenase SsuD/methylene tetrahydromethanopterin reductase-like flavin-dependent oxidoreductase (luciferase family)
MDEVGKSEVQGQGDEYLIFSEDPAEIKPFIQITPILGRTLEEAQAKHDRYRKTIDWEGGLAKLSSFVNFDFSKLPSDEPFILC